MSGKLKKLSPISLVIDMTDIYYAGIGPRAIDKITESNFILIGERLAQMGRILRSGAAPGSDNAFEIGCIRANGRKEVYLPWNGFEGRKTEPECGYMSINYDLKDELDRLVSTFHPKQDLSQGIKKMMMRNCHQVLGYYLKTLIKFVITSAKDLKFDTNNKICNCKGGTGFAVRLAHSLHIPIYSLNVPEHFTMIENYLNIKLNK